MPVGTTAHLANKILDHLRGGTSWTAPAGLYLKLHLGDPGASGTANPAACTARKQVVFGNAASSGVISNTASAQWTSADGTVAETITHWSLWDAASGGNCLMTGALTSSVAVSLNGTITLNVGGCSPTFTVAS